MIKDETRTPTPRRWRASRRRRGVAGTLTGVLERTTTAVRELEEVVGQPALAPLLAELTGLRGARMIRLRAACVDLRLCAEALRQAGETGTDSDVARRRLHEVEGRLLEAHWLARQAVTRATSTAMDLQRMCAVTSDIGETVDLLRGLGAETSELVRVRRSAA